MPAWASHTQIKVYDEYGICATRNSRTTAAIRSGRSRLPVQSGLTLPVVQFDGKISAATGDTIVVSYQTPQGFAVELGRGE
jgi:hypothetical protein